MIGFRYNALLILLLGGALVDVRADDDVVTSTVMEVANITPEEQALARLMSQARQAMDEGKYTQAVKSYGDVLAKPANRFQVEAQEYLGLALERSGETNAAKSAYERYLQLYPEGEGAERMRQRLAGLVTAAWQPRPKAQIKTHPVQEGWTSYGYFGQHLRRDELSINGQPRQIVQWALANDMDFNARDRHQDYDIKTRVSGGYLYDLNQATGNQAQLSSAYVDVDQRKVGFTARFGRQIDYTGVSMGRFDGINLGYRFTPKTTLNLLSGFPVELSRIIKPDTTRYFYGAHIENVSIEDWGFGAYAVEQRADGFLDRRAVGSEVRYINLDRYVSSLLDYDVSFHKLNFVNIQGSRTWADITTLTWVLDYRNSPPLTMRNALSGQTATSLTDLHALYTEDGIRALAQDRTTRMRMAMIGLGRRLTDRVRLDSDLTMSSMGGAPASGGLEAMPASGNEYNFSTRFTGTDFPRIGQVSSVGLRIGNSYTADSAGLFLDTRLSAYETWHIYPRVQVNYANYRNQDQTQWVAGPGLRVEYALGKSTLFEFEGSMEWTRQQLLTDTQDTRAYHVNLGYRVNF